MTRRPEHPPQVVDLGRLRLVPGAAARLDLPVAIGDVRLAGEPYAVDPARPEARLDVHRSGSGLGMRLRLGATVSGPCQRCLGPARVGVTVDAREFQASGREHEEEYDDDLDSDYLSGPRRLELDIDRWGRDAFVEALPMTVLCREDCLGLCPRCGADLNAGPCGCTPEVGDARWTALGGLAERLAREEGPGE